IGPAGQYGIGWSLIFLGDVALNQGDPERAEASYSESVSVLRALGEKSFLAYSLRRLGILALHRDDSARAAALCQESLALNVELEERSGIVLCLMASAAILAAQGEIRRAAQLFGAVETLFDTLAISCPTIDRIEYERNRDALRAQLDEAAWAEAHTIGRTLTLEQAIAYAQEKGSWN
ncbi:MAG: hypothetical protein L0Y55_00665, partial [Anaerolineales bacterium]|nr:hypothetical protein [Anaerolineales bacterium]